MTSSSPKENRGGSRKNQHSDEVTRSIIEFISELKCAKKVTMLEMTLVEAICHHSGQ